MTIHNVDPIALRQKLKKLGIGAGSERSQTFAEDAVKEVLQWSRVPNPPGARDLPERCPELRLEPAELAYCLHNWALLWEVPA